MSQSKYDFSQYQEGQFISSAGETVINKLVDVPGLSESNIALLTTLLQDLDLNINSDCDDLRDEVLYQPVERQNQIWTWMDSAIRDLDTHDEAVKIFAEVLGRLFGIPGASATETFKVTYTALSKARRKRKELPPNYDDPLNDDYLTPDNFQNEGQWLVAIFDRYFSDIEPKEIPIALREPMRVNENLFGDV